MFSALIDALVEMFAAALGWVARILRGASVDAGAEAAAQVAGDGDVSDRKARRRAIRRFKSLAAAGKTDELASEYRRLGRGEDARDLRIEALLALAAADSTVAAPLLADVIERPDDPWVVTMALNAVAEHRMFELSDVVARAKDDPRPIVSKLATDVQRRLDKAGRRTHA